VGANLLHGIVSLLFSGRNLVACIPLNQLLHLLLKLLFSALELAFPFILVCLLTVIRCHKHTCFGDLSAIFVERCLLFSNLQLKHLNFSGGIGDPEDQSSSQNHAASQIGKHGYSRGLNRFPHFCVALQHAQRKIAASIRARAAGRA